MKYIIDVPDNAGWIEYYQPSSENSICFHGTAVGISELTPYTEPDRKAIEDEVLEFVRCVHKMNGDDYHECFDIADVSDEDYCTKYSYQEAKAQYEAWLKQKNELHVGDEIVGIYSNGEISPPLVVLKVEGDYYYGIYSKTGEFVQGGLNYEKTGRHFPEVAELLDKMRGEE